MDIESARIRVCDALNSLQEQGLKVKITPSHSAGVTSLVEKWAHVSISNSNEDEAALVFQKQKELIKMGVAFDSGGCSGLRDWEIDWSLRVESDADSHLQRCAEVENLISNTGSEPND